MFLTSVLLFNKNTLYAMNFQKLSKLKFWSACQLASPQCGTLEAKQCIVQPLFYTTMANSCLAYAFRVLTSVCYLCVAFPFSFNHAGHHILHARGGSRLLEKGIKMKLHYNVWFGKVRPKKVTLAGNG